MKQNKLLYNNLLRTYNKCKRRLSNLMAMGRNTNRQIVLQKHIERLYAKLMNLQASIQRGTVVASVAFATLALNSNTAQAQTYGSGQTNPFNLASVGNNSTPTFADLDNDGDKDIISGSYLGDFYYFQNIGSSTVPNYSAAVTNPFGLTTVTLYSAPVFVDLDNDGDKDIVSGGKYGDFYYFQNTGTSTVPNYSAAVSSPFGLANLPYNYSTPAFVDLDNDGDLDVISGSSFGNFYYFQNTGTASAPAYVAGATNPFSLTNTAYYSSPTFADLDGDGDKDMLSGITSGDYLYYQNTGTASAPVYAAPVSNPFFLAPVGGSASTPVFVDLDNDIDFDLMSGDNIGNFQYYENTIPGPAAALNFNSSLSGDNVVLPAAVSSSLSTSNKLTVEAWVRPTSNFSGTGSIIGDYANPASQMQFLLRFTPTNYQFWIGSSSFGVYTNVTSIASPTIGAWQHVAGVWNGTVASIYINGVLSATASVTYTSLGVSSNSLVIAGNAFGENFNGDIDEVRIWNVARTACQINDYRKGEIPTSASGLLANYHFNQGMSPAVNTTVTTLVDASGNAYTGNITSMSLNSGTSNWVRPGGVVSGYTTSGTGNLNVTVGNSSICPGGTTTLTATGANTYTWTGGVINGVAFSPTVTNSYTVTGTTTLTGCTNSVVSSVTVNASPIVSVNSGAICKGNVFTITPSGANTYTIQGGNAVVSPTASASYTVVGTSAAGCVSASSATSNITVNPNPTVTAVSATSLICVGQSATLTANGANYYLWNTAATTSLIVVFPSITTTYTVTGSDINGCENTAVVTQSVSTCAGLTESGVANSGFKVFPNPSIDVFNLQTPTAAAITIMDVLGKIILSTKVEAGMYQLNLNEQANGIYFLKIESNSQTETIKLIKE
ncbi:MAG: VCBS repeat-containing protein [Sphingobacteriaceae bacterium]|nr:VCBS repeat-containing protein [Sphingobacteriaceae bacterium]